MASETAEPEPTPFRLRHEAGLASGDVIALRPGRHQFGPEARRAGSAAAPIVSFEIEVEVEGADVLVTLVAHRDGPPSTPLTLDGKVVEARTHVEDGQVIGIGPDSFVLERLEGDRSPDLSPIDRPTAIVVPPRPDIAPPAVFLLPLALAILLAALVLVAFVDLGFWPTLVPTGLLVIGAAFRQRRLDADQCTASRTLQNQRCEDFRRSLVLTARGEARRRRDAAISSHHVMDAFRDRRRLPGDVPVAIALGTSAWRPELEGTAMLDLPLREVLTLHGSLPAVPISIEPTQTLLGIVGPPSARRAVARHVLSATRQRDRPVRFELSVPPDLRPLWSPVPPDPVGAASTSQRVMVLVEYASPGRRPEAGVILADRADDLAFEPDLLMTLNRDGLVSLSVPGAEQAAEGLAPIGITAARFRDLSFSIGPTTRERRDGATTAREDGSRPVPGPILVSVGSTLEELGIVATVVFDVVRDQPTTRLVVLDGSDRGLGGLRELPSCIAYAATAEEHRPILRWLSTTPSIRTPLLVVVRDLDAPVGAPGIEHDAPTELESVIARSFDGELLLVATVGYRSDRKTGTSDWFPTSVTSQAGRVLVATPTDRRWIARRRLSPGDVGVVARAFARRQTGRTRKPRVRADPAPGEAWGTT